MMVMPSPARRDHVDLIGRARMPPADSCTAARQSQAQKRSIVQWRSRFSTALWGANVGFGMAGGAGAGGEGTSSGVEASWPARF